jgi:cytochrome c-type biogenesis protein CcmF
MLSLALGVRNFLLLGVLAIATLTIASLTASLFLDSRRRRPRRFAAGLWETLREQRRAYGGYVVHVGIMVLAVGVAGSALGTQRREAVMNEGETFEWAGREVHYVRLIQRETPDKLIAEAVLHIRRGSGGRQELRPARHLHLLQNEWTTEVAIHSTWRGDFYTILNAGLGGGQVVLTLVDNPLVPWIWTGGFICLGGVVTAMFPARAARRRASKGADPAASTRRMKVSEDRRRAA